MKYLDKSLLILVAVALSFIYGLGVVVYVDTGGWPAFGNPQSWTDWQPGLFFQIMYFYLILCLIIAAFGSLLALIKLVKIVVKWKYDADYLVNGFMLALYVFYISDPMGLLEWYFD